MRYTLFYKVKTEWGQQNFARMAKLKEFVLDTNENKSIIIYMIVDNSKNRLIHFSDYTNAFYTE